MQTTPLPMFLVTVLCFAACAGPSIDVEPAEAPALAAQYEPNNASEISGSSLSREFQVKPIMGSSVSFTGLTCGPGTGGTPNCSGAATFEGSVNALVPPSVYIKVTSTGATASGIVLYKVEYAEIWPRGEWKKFCQDGTGPNAVVLMGTWDKSGKFSPAPSGDRFSFACTQSAAGKCQTDPNLYDTRRLDHFQTCTRMLRADYCGTGKSHTITGRRISVKDNVSVNPNWDHDPDGRPWFYEAAWWPGGAKCVRGLRVASKPIDGTIQPEENCGLTVAHEYCRRDYASWPAGVLMQTLTDDPILKLISDPDAEACYRKGTGFCK